MPSSNNKHQQMRRNLINLAALKFNREGFDQVSVAQLSRELELSKTAIYYYVKDKQELLFICYEETCRFIEESIEYAEQSPPDKAKIYTVLDGVFAQWVDIVKGERSPSAIIQATYALKDEHRAIIAERYTLIVKRLASLIISDISNHQLRDADPMISALALCALIRYSPTLFINRPTIEEVQLLQSEVMSIIKYGLSRARDSKLNSSAFSEKITDKILSELHQNMNPVDSLFQAASRQFNSLGYAKSSIDIITAQLNLTKGALYHYMRSKQELLHHCFMRSLALELFVFQRAQELNLSPFIAITHASRALFDINLGPTGPLIHKKHLSALKLTNQKTILQKMDQIHEMIAQFILKGQKEGSIRNIDPSITARLLTGVIEQSQDVASWTNIILDHTRSNDFLDIMLLGLEPQ